MPSLVVHLEDAAPVTHELTEDHVTLGRIDENTVQIEDPSVSSRHAELTLHGTDYVLQDIGSTNGTQLNDKPLPPQEEHMLQAGDVIVFGNIRVQYLSDVPGEARPLPVESAPTLVPADTSVQPSNFANASPFATKTKKKDPAGMAIMALAVLAILAFAGAVFSILQLKSPL